MLTDFGVFLASIPDAVRLVILPVFAWIAWTDIKTRRVENRVWIPLLAVGGVLFVWEAIRTFGTIDWQFFAIPAAISVFVVIPAAYVIWLVGGFGGADAKAIMTLAVFFPTYPSYYIGGGVYPVFETITGSFAFTIFSNAVVLAVLIPVGITALNIVTGNRSKVMFLGVKKPVTELKEIHGRLLETEAGYSRNGLDLDVLRMYLQWRGVTIGELRSDPHAYRHPATVQRDVSPQDTDGIEDSGDGYTSGRNTDIDIEDCDWDTLLGRDEDPDWWGATEFMDDVDHVYGMSAADIRDGLEVIVQEDTVWVSPGTPFMVPIFAGIVVALLYGNVLFGLLVRAGAV